MAFVKDMLRMWAHSWKRFISIAMITLLGVAVLTGIYAGCRDAFRSTDRFFDAQGLHDVQVLSTAGLSNGDIAALRKVNGVAKVQAERSQEVTFDLDGRKSATMQEIGTNGIDQPYLQEGRIDRKSRRNRGNPKIYSRFGQAYRQPPHRNPRIGFLRYFRYERYERCGRHE